MSKNRYWAVGLMVMLCWLTIGSVHAAGPKREFRGAWMKFVNGMYLGKSTVELQ